MRQKHPRDVSRLTCVQQHDSPQQHLLSLSLTLVLLRKSWHKEHDLHIWKIIQKPHELTRFLINVSTECRHSPTHPPTRSRLCWKEPLPIFNASAMSSAGCDNFTKVQEVVQWLRDPVKPPHHSIWSDGVSNVQVVRYDSSQRLRWGGSKMV